MILVDRSRYETLLTCPTKRYLKYHALGTGIVLKRNSLPLLSGTTVHEALHKILLLVVQNDQQIPPAEDIDRVIKEATTAFQDEVRKNGLEDHDLSQEDAAFIEEQMFLLEAMVLGWVRGVLPELLSKYEIIQPEYEADFTLGDHSRVTFMSRPDVVARNKATRRLSVFDFKTKKELAKNATDEYMHSIQMATQTKAVEVAMGEPVTEYNILVLLKGARRNEYDRVTKTYSGPAYQASNLCYGFYLPANPPIHDADIQVSRDYTDATGRNRELSKDYKRTFVGELMTPRQWVNEYMTLEEIQQNYRWFGPYERQSHLIPDLLREINETEETYNRKVVEYAKNGLTFEEEVLSLPTAGCVRAWTACWDYNSRCEYYDICYRSLGWQDWQKRFVPRTPHHEREALERAKSI